MNQNQPNNSNLNSNEFSTQPPIVPNFSQMPTTSFPPIPGVSPSETSSAPETTPVEQVEKGGNGKLIVLILFFIALALIVWYLPDISKKIEELKSGNKPAQFEKIIDGTMVCKLETRTDTLTKSYEQTFTYSNNQLDRLKYVVESKGTTDEVTVIADQCEKIKDLAQTVDGLSVSCEGYETSVREVHDFNLQLLDFQSVNSAYIEAGGVYPAEFKHGDDMDKIEKQMNANGYECVRSVD